MDYLEIFKRARRVFDGNYSPRKVLLGILIALVLLLYIGPYILRMFSGPKQISLLSDSAQHSLTSRIGSFKSAVSSLDAHILYTHPKIERHEDQLHHHSDDEELLSMPLQNFAPYVGNGYIGAWVHDKESTEAILKYSNSLYIKQGRHLNQSIPYEPIFSVTVDGGLLHEAIVSHYTTATVHKLQAWEISSLQENHRKAGSTNSGSGVIVGGTVEVTHRIYAHRTLPSLMIQDIVVLNPNPVSVFIRINKIGEQNWARVVTDTVTVESSSAGDNKYNQYSVVTGTIPAPVLLQHRHAQASSNVIVVAVATLNLPGVLEVGGHKSTTLHVLTAVNYSESIPQHQVAAQLKICKEGVIKTIREAVQSQFKLLATSHTDAWSALWNSGLNMLTSRAEGSVNGDVINTTLYNVLSQVRAPLLEISTPLPLWTELSNYLSPSGSEGCYQGHYTLQADKLWSHLSTPEDVNRVVSNWLMTLEMQGCHNLVRAGADGVLQAMLLSFGGLCFRNQHLEFNTQAKDLHRDFTFRRLSYGVDAQLNLTVEVQDHDLKPVLLVSLEQRNKQLGVSNGQQQPFIHEKYLERIRGLAGDNTSHQPNLLTFYACDGGCLDPPVQLSLLPVQFPVKLTEPLTAVLYITSDKEHMEQLKQTIHVREVAIAPGHQQAVIALHRHGHRWGRLPVLFWLTIAVLIVTFHLFLFKLVVNEYCGPDSRIRKLSDF